MRSLRRKLCSDCLGGGKNIERIKVHVNKDCYHGKEISTWSIFVIKMHNWTGIGGCDAQSCLGEEVSVSIKNDD